MHNSLNTWLFVPLGACSILAFSPFDIYPVAWVCLIPLLIREDVKPWYRQFFEGYLYGIGYYGLGLIWLPESIGSYMEYPPALSWMMFAVIVGFLALFTALFKWLLGHVPHGRIRVLIIAPALWVALEAVRFSSWGGLPWLSLAVTQINGPIAEWFPILGEPGINLLIVVLNGLIFLSGQRLLAGRKRQSIKQYLDIASVFVIGATASFFLSNVNWVRPTGKTIEAGIVQASVPSTRGVVSYEQDNIINDYRKLAAKITSAVDLFIFPESAVWLKTSEWKDYFERSLVNETSHLVGVMEQTLGNYLYNSSVLITSEETAVYRKQRRVPLAENRLIWLSDFFESDVYQNLPVLEGRITEPVRWGNIDLGMAICWEIRFTSVLSNSVLAGADILINQANESWLYSNVARRRTLSAARVRAAENGRMLIRVANRGTSAVIGVRGELVETFPGQEKLAKNIHASVYSGLTPYVKYRSVIVINLMSFIIIILGFGYYAVGHKRIRKPDKIRDNAGP